MKKRRVNNQVPTNLSQLQHETKKDPESYREEFEQQLRHYQAYIKIFILNPSEYVESLDKTVHFLAHVFHCFSEDLAEFPQQLMEILRSHQTTLNPEMRLSFCRVLILLRNKDKLPAITILELFFSLLQCQDKTLRKFLKSHIIADIKNINAKHRNFKVNSSLQNFMYNVLNDSNAKAVKMSLEIMIELYLKQIWNDAKTVNVIATACFSRSTKVMVTAIKFFLGKDEGEEKERDDESSDDDTPTSKELIMANRVNKKTRKRDKQLVKAKALLKKDKKKKKKTNLNASFSALHLIYDPQAMAEKLFQQLKTGKETRRFEVKLMAMNFISRLIGVHQLFLLNFYPHLERILQPHQREVTKLLQYAAQACHELVPPDVVESLLTSLANNFVTERNFAEVMTVGLNAIREICARCPYAMSEDLLSDLALYKSYRDKNVVMAARSLIQVYRNVNPQLLNRKHRGKPSEATKNIKPKQYGEIEAHDFISGAEALGEVVSENEYGEYDSEEEDSDDDSDGWVDVQHSSNEEEIAEENWEDPEELAKKAAAISQTRILTQEDFKKIKIAQLNKQLAPPSRGQKRKRTVDVDEEGDGNGELVKLAAIERLHKRPKMDKEGRMASIIAGREGREKFGSKKKRMNPNASVSNKRKKKNKAFMMVKHKIRGKTKRSFRDKQIALRNSLLKQKKMK